MRDRIDQNSVAKTPHDEAVLENASVGLARVFLESGAVQDAEAAIQMQLANDMQPTAEVLLVWGEILRRQGSPARARAVLDGMGCPPEPSLAAEWRLLDARLLFGVGDYAECLRRYTEEVSKPSGSICEIRLKSVLSAAAAQCQQIPQSRNFSEAVISDSQRLGWQEGVANGLVEIALLDRIEGHWERADGFLMKARDTYRQLGLSRKYIMATLNLGLQRLWRGHLTFAEEALREATRLAVEIGDVQLETSARADRGLALVRLGRLDEARADLARALQLARRQASPRRLAIALEYTGELHIAAGNLQRATENLRRALAIANRIAPEGDIVPEVLRRQAEVALGLDDLDESSRLAADAAEKAARLGDRYEEATALRVKGQILQQQGEVESSRAVLRKSLDILEGLGETFERDRILKLLEDPEEIAARTLGEGTPPVKAAALPTASTVSARGKGSKELIALLRKHGMVGSCQALVDMMREISQVTSLDIPVLIQGETGTGKELVARAIHEMGQWSRGPMVAFNCATCPPDLLDAELFGHTRGAYTGAFTPRDGLVRSAKNGTLFLDEIGELREESQARLLRFLDSGEIRPLGSDGVHRVRVRVIAATHVNLEERIRDRKFRRDLFFRLAGIRLALPPLRDRRSDIRQLVAYFVDESRSAMHKNFKGISESVIRAMEAANWPGNVRQLKSEVQRLVATAPEGKVVDRWIPSDGSKVADLLPKSDSLEILDDRDKLRELLIKRGGRVADVARILGISKGHLYRCLRRFQIDSSELRTDE